MRARTYLTLVSGSVAAERQRSEHDARTRCRRPTSGGGRKVMEFTLDDEQRALQETARSFLAEHAPGPYVRSMLDDDRGDPDGPGISDELWQRLVDLGWVGLLVPEELGGTGAGLLEVMVVLEEMGRLP